MFINSGGTILNRSDDSTTVVFSLATFPSTFENTDWIDVQGYSHVEFLLSSSFGTVTDLTASVQYTHSSAGRGVYELTVEDLDTSGSPVVVKQYSYLINAGDAFSASDAEYGIPVPVQGKFMRLRFKGGPSVSGDEVKVEAYRRTSK